MGQRRVNQAGPNTRYLEKIAKDITQAIIGGERAKYELGRLIDEVVVGHYWSRADWPGAPASGWPDSTAGFKQWCWSILGFKYRKAYYLRNNYLAIGPQGMNLDPNSMLFTRSMRVGWTKLAAVLSVAKTKEELSTWLDKVEYGTCTVCDYSGPSGEGTCPRCSGKMGESLTETQLRIEIKLAQGNDDEGQNAPTPREAATASTAIGTAGGIMPSGDVIVDPETGEPVGGGTATSKKDGTRVQFPLVFENQDAVRLFVRGLDVVKHRTNTDSNGEAAARMAAGYLASCPRDVEGGLVVDLDQRIRAMELAFGVRLHVMPAAPPTPSGAAMEGFGT